MPELATSFQPRSTLTAEGRHVKGLIISCGLKLQAVANEAKMHKSTLSAYLVGRVSGRDGRFAIWMAFCRLSGSRISFSSFWSPALECGMPLEQRKGA